jgi:excisionase family DNA binding protein
MSNFNLARELGIDLEALHREHPSHPDQLRLHREIARRGEQYWVRERFLTQLGTEEPDWFPDIVNGYSWMTVAQVAQHLWVSESTVRNWVKRGLLPAQREGEKGLRISREELDNLQQPILPRKVKKPAKLRRYVPTDAQLEVARRSLNAKDSM